LTTSTAASTTNPDCSEFPEFHRICAKFSRRLESQLAIDMYVHRIKQTIGAMAATLGGIDCLVFTAGVGEHSAEIRARVCENMDFLGVELDRNSNENCKPEPILAAHDRGHAFSLSPPAKI
jgi:acetate kinase